MSNISARTLNKLKYDLGREFGVIAELKQISSNSSLPEGMRKTAGDILAEKDRIIEENSKKELGAVDLHDMASALSTRPRLTVDEQEKLQRVADNAMLLEQQRQDFNFADDLLKALENADLE